MAMRKAIERRFRTSDGVELFYRYWPAPAGTPRGALVLFHRGHEHSGRMAHLADEFDLPDFAMFAWDARGYGNSAGKRGSSPSVGRSVEDVEDFAAHIQAEWGIPRERLAVVAQSVGAVLAAAWVHDYAPPLRALVLASPAFKAKLYIPFARSALRLRQRWRGDFSVNSHVRPRFLTHDRERIASYRSDPLIVRPIASNILLGLDELSERVIRDARAIVVPTQLLIAGSDWVVAKEPQHRFYERLGGMVKERHVLPGFFHDTLGERDRAVPIAEARRFILDRFSGPPEFHPLADADRLGETRDEADRLATPLSPLSRRGLSAALSRLGIRIGGMLSDGIKLGRSTGFDSGSMLDYVYRNQPSGRGRIGRAIDRRYLGLVGWRGIRQRKANLEAILHDAMIRLREKNQPIRLLDIAAGHGRYVLDTVSKTSARPGGVLLLDHADDNVAAGAALIKERGLSQIARFEKGDAFDAESIASIEPRPTIGIVSGLYELFPENPLVQRSLGGLAAAMPPGGYLIYTGQPWHPRLELIARTLTSHRGGRPWVMRRRTQAELDQLVAGAGFRKVHQRIDEWGIFTVSLAERVE